MHYAEGMLELRVGRPRVDVIRKGELLNSAQALKNRGINHRRFNFIEVDEAVNWVSKLQLIPKKIPYRN